MAGRKRHVVNIRDIPRADDQAARIRTVADLVQQVGDLVDGAPVRRRPGPPLVAIDRPQIAVRVRPLVPDRDAVVVQVADIGVTLEEPKQLMDDRLGVNLFGRDQRETI